MPEGEPTPDVRLPPCPKELRGEARKEWKRIGRLLLDLGLVTDLDRAALAAYCQCWARWLHAEGMVNELGPVIMSGGGMDENGDPIPPDMITNPYLIVAEKSLKQMSRLMVEFGLTPSSRTRVKPAKGQGETDPLEDILSGSAG